MREGAKAERKAFLEAVAWQPIQLADVLGSLAGGYFVQILSPVTGKREPITAAAWEGQAVVWVRRVTDVHHLVIRISDNHYSTFYHEAAFGDNPETIYFKEYSFDRKTWHPFLREVSGGWQVVASTEEGV
jgi:hypothetical protein